MDNIGFYAKADVKISIDNASATVYFDDLENAKSFLEVIPKEVSRTLHLINPRKDARIIRVTATENSFRRKRAQIFGLIKDGMTVFEFTQAVKKLGGDASDLGYFIVRSAVALEGSPREHSMGAGR